MKITWAPIVALALAATMGAQVGNSEVAVDVQPDQSLIVKVLKPVELSQVLDRLCRLPQVKCQISDAVKPSLSVMVASMTLQGTGDKVLSALLIGSNVNFLVTRPPSARGPLVLIVDEKPPLVPENPILARSVPQENAVPVETTPAQPYSAAASEVANADAPGDGAVESPAQQQPVNGNGEENAEFNNSAAAEIGSPLPGIRFDSANAGGAPLPGGETVGNRNLGPPLPGVPTTGSVPSGPPLP